MYTLYVALEYQPRSHTGTRSFCLLPLIEKGKLEALLLLTHLLLLLLLLLHLQPLKSLLLLLLLLLLPHHSPGDCSCEGCCGAGHVMCVLSCRRARWFVSIDRVSVIYALAAAISSTTSCTTAAVLENISGTWSNGCDGVVGDGGSACDSEWR